MSEAYIYTVKPKDGGVWMSADDWVAIVAELSTRGIDVNMVGVPDKGTIRFTLKEPKTQ